jgi:hypothetical protein
MYYAERMKCIINICEIIQNFLILKYMLHENVVITELEIVRQYATLIEMNFELQQIAWALSLINLLKTKLNLL